MSTGDTYDGWLVVFESSTDYEAELVRDRLGDAGLGAVVLTHRDHAFNLTVGRLANVRVLVPLSEYDEAVAILTSAPVSDAELMRQAIDADPRVPAPLGFVDEPEAGDIGAADGDDAAHESEAPGPGDASGPDDIHEPDSGA